MYALILSAMLAVPAVSMDATPSETVHESTVGLAYYVKDLQQWHLDDLSGTWFRSWRSSRVADHYSTLASRYSDAVISYHGADKRLLGYAKTCSTGYREIAELILLGAKPTTEENSPADHYSARVAQILREIYEAEAAAFKDFTWAVARPQN